MQINNSQNIKGLDSSSTCFDSSKQKYPCGVRWNDDVRKRGFTLIELVIYVAGLLALGTVMIVIIVQFYALYKEIISVPRADRAGLSLVDQITKEIRSADSIDAINSQFGTTAGALDLDTVTNGVVVGKRFFVQNGRVALSQTNSDSTSFISPKDLTVSNFNFTYVSTPVSEAVKFNLELQFKTRNATTTKSYTGFAILRESYD